MRAHHKRGAVRWDIVKRLAPGIVLGAALASLGVFSVLKGSVLALLFAAIYARIVRGNMIDAMNEDYVRTARAKGLRERQVVVKHELRASIAPVITLLAIDLGVLVGGTIVTESVFNLPGLGRWLLVAAETNDLPVTLAVTVLVATAVSVLSLVADILYAVLDPRVRYR